MTQITSRADWERLSRMNLAAMELCARLLQAERPWFSEKEVASFAEDCGLSAADAFRALVSAACGLESDTHPTHRELERGWLYPAIRCLDPSAYTNDPFYRSVHFPEASWNGWQYTRLSYAPYQLFPCGDTCLLPDGREIQPLGYFTRPYSYPAVLEQGREWMTATPNEMETMRADIAAAQGRVALLGLGLGYFAFMAARKEEVHSVTVVERDPQVIALFRQHLLPQFPCLEKLHLLRADAFDVFSAGAHPPYDFVFVDLWHDLSDGVPLYLRFRKLEEKHPGTRFRYWIEPSILVFLRELLLEDWIRQSGRLDRLLPRDPVSLERALSPENVRTLALRLSPEDVR